MLCCCCHAPEAPESDRTPKEDLLGLGQQGQGKRKGEERRVPRGKAYSLALLRIQRLKAIDNSLKASQLDERRGAL